jgi:hypothetical protein
MCRAGSEAGNTEGRGQSPRPFDSGDSGRVVQGALKLILEPIFETDFQPGSFGYRHKRTAHDAVDRVARAIVQQKTRIIDIDLRSYLDRASYCILAYEAWLERCGCEQLRLMRGPFLRQRLTSGFDLSRS